MYIYLKKIQKRRNIIQKKLFIINNYKVKEEEKEHLSHKQKERQNRL